MGIDKYRLKTFQKASLCRHFENEVYKRVNEKTNQTVNVMGLKDKSAGYTVKTSNFPPSESEIVNKVKSIISKEKRRKKNG